MMTPIQATCGPFSRESWPTLCDIEACRNLNGTRPACAIHDVCGSGNPVLRRLGNHTVRVLRRKATQGRGVPAVVRADTVIEAVGRENTRTGEKTTPQQVPRRWSLASPQHACGPVAGVGGSGQEAWGGQILEACPLSLVPVACGGGRCGPAAPLRAASPDT